MVSTTRSTVKVTETLASRPCRRSRPSTATLFEKHKACSKKTPLVVESSSFLLCAIAVDGGPKGHVFWDPPCLEPQDLGREHHETLALFKIPTLRDYRL